MKSAMVCMVLAAALAVVGCGDDDDPPAGAGGTGGSGGSAGAGGTAGSGGTAGTGGTAGNGGMMGGSEIDPTPVIGALMDYPQGSGNLFDGPIEAHWYQWNGSYVVLYRGFDAAGGTALCPGNSIQIGQSFANVTNSPWMDTAAAVCSGVSFFATAPAGVFGCGGLLYYVTEIPTSAIGLLRGTLEFNDGSGFIGASSAAQTDLANTPEFEPGLDSYDLPPSTVDDLDVVNCN